MNKSARLSNKNCFGYDIGYSVTDNGTIVQIMTQACTFWRRYVRP